MTNFLWHKQSLLLILSLWFMWNVLNYGHSYSLTVEDLIKYEGQVTTANKLQRAGGKAAYTSFEVKLNKHPKHLFKVATYNSSDSVIVSSAFEIGTSVMIYTEPKFLETLANREPSHYIVRAQKSGKTLIDKFEVSREVTKNLVLINLFGLFVFGGLYVYKTMKRARNTVLGGNTYAVT
jgi:hypothetical protein